MTTELNSIVFSLNAAINQSQEIVNMSAVADAVGQLELFPMTIELLQVTRIGKLLNTIRKQTDRSLQSRIRHIIRCWQELMKKEHTYQTIAPKYIQYGDGGVIHLENSQNVRSTNGNNGKLPRPATVTQLGSLANNSVPVSPALSQNSAKSAPFIEKHQSSNAVNSAPNKLNNKRRESTMNQKIGHTSPKRRKVDNSSSSFSVARTSSASAISKHSHKHPHGANGFTDPKYATHHSNLSIKPDPDNDAHSVDSDVSNPIIPPLNIAPKVKSTTELLAMFNSSVSKDTVTKILTNEICKEPEMPQSALPESVRPRQYKSKLQKEKLLTAQENSVNDSVTAAKSEMLAKFLNNTIEFQTSSDSSAPSFEKTKSTLMCSQTADEQIFDEQTIPPEPSSSDVIVKKHKKHKKKKLKKSPLPVTNFSDDIPDLPPIPDDLDWHSLDYTSDKHPIADISVVPKILNDNWPGVNCVLDESNEPVPFTSMYSVSLPERSVHILPWTDLNGWLGEFLPTNEETAPPPDPW